MVKEVVKLIDNNRTEVRGFREMLPLQREALLALEPEWPGGRTQPESWVWPLWV